MGGLGDGGYALNGATDDGEYGLGRDSGMVVAVDDNDDDDGKQEMVVVQVQDADVMIGNM